MVRVLKWVLGAFVTVFLLAVGINIMAALDQRSPSEKIEESCRKEFGEQGEDAVSRCRLSVSTRVIMENQRDRLNSAYDRVR